MEEEMESRPPIITDLTAEAAKLRMFYGRTPQTTFTERRDSGSAVHLGRYRDGMLLLGKSAGKSHWETHPEDELLYVLDGEMTVCPRKGRAAIFRGRRRHDRHRSPGRVAPCSLRGWRDGGERDASR